MSEFVVVNLMVIVFRTIMIVLGFCFAYLGYMLFVKGVYEKAGELKAAWGDKNLVLKQAAPGTFFALFGVIVIAISILRGTGLEISERNNASQIMETAQEYPMISSFLEEEGLQIEGSWDKAQQELALLHNVRAIWQQALIPAESFKAMFHDVLVPVLKEKADNKRGGRVANVRKELILSMQAPSVYSINAMPAANANRTEDYTDRVVKK